MRNFHFPPTRYLQGLLTKLHGLLLRNVRRVQEQAVTAVASVADVAEEHFAPFYDAFMPGSWLKAAATLSDDTAPSASLDHLEAQAAPTHPRAPPEHLGGLPWPQEPASGRPKVLRFSTGRLLLAPLPALRAAISSPARQLA